MRNFNEIFREDVPYDYIKGHKKLEFHSLIRRCIFSKITERGEIDPSPAVLGLKSGITDLISHNYVKIEINSYSFLPSEKSITFHNIVALIKSVFCIKHNYLL